MPITCATFLIGCLALAGMPPLAGFFSKDAVLAAVQEKAHALEQSLATPESEAGHAEHAGVERGLSRGQMERHQVVYTVLYYGALVTALLTAFYTFRAFFLTFCGVERIPHEAGHHAHESPAAMTIPLAILAVCAVVVGMFEPAFVKFLLHSPSLAWATLGHAHEAHEFPWLVAAISTFCCFVPGVGLAAYLYLGDSREITWLAGFMRFQWLAQLADLAWLEQVRRTPLVGGSERGLRRLGLGGLCSVIGYAVQLLAVILLAPVLVARFVSPIRLSRHKFYFDELYSWLLVKPLVGLGHVSYAFDRFVVDGVVNFCGQAPLAVGSLMRSLQMGLVQFYALAMLLGVLLLVAVKMIYLS